jgi:hypothetical protein
MRIALAIIAAGLFGGILANLVSDDIANRLSSWLGPNYEPAIYIAFVLVLFLNVWLFARDRGQSKRAPPSDQVRAEFEAIWPAFFETLEDDLRKCEASVVLARNRAKDSNPHPGIEIHSPSVTTQFTVYHQRTISNYDKELGVLLRDFLKASDNLRLAANTYNQLLYADLQRGQDVGVVDKLTRLFNNHFAAEDMYKKSRSLEDAMDNLGLKLRYYSDLKPN